MLKRKFCLFTSRKIVFNWGCLPRRPSSSFVDFLLFCAQYESTVDWLSVSSVKVKEKVRVPGSSNLLQLQPPRENNNSLHKVWTFIFLRWFWQAIATNPLGETFPLPRLLFFSVRKTEMNIQKKNEIICSKKGGKVAP